VWDDFVLFIAVGFAAQLVDGAIGMAYGLSATTVMLSVGIPPATASAASTRPKSSPPASPACRTGVSATWIGPSSGTWRSRAC
jgi:hypothetical protein